MALVNTYFWPSPCEEVDAFRQILPYPLTLSLGKTLLAKQNGRRRAGVVHREAQDCPTVESRVKGLNGVSV